MNAGYLKNWITKADNDLEIVKHELKLPESEWVTDVICFHCQQAAEKYLKALLIYMEKDVPKTHNIEYLQTLLKESHPEISELEVKDLSLFGVDVRYPDDFYIPSAEEVRYYSTLAIRIQKMVLDNIAL